MFASIAFIVDTYLWFLVAAMIIGILTGWFASSSSPEPTKKSST